MFTSLVQTLVGIGSAWLFVYLTEYLWRTFHRREVLPTFHPRTSSSTTVALQKLELTIRTTACNGIYAHVVGMLGRKRRLHRSLQIFYEAGSVIGICGSSLVLLLLLFSCGQSILSLVRLPPNPSLKRPTLGKREIPQEQVIQPIIPGLTVPASDIPLIVIVVLFSQIVHELGHALAGALDQLPISEIGLSLTVIIPSAFVGSPVSSFDALPVKARRRIVSAGPFHNLVFWVCLLLLDQAAFVYPLLGYQDLSEIGLVVVSVNPYSPLYSHLPQGTLITQLDDVVMNGNTDIWSTYLRSSSRGIQDGWCIQPSIASDQRCCDATGETRGISTSCFTSWATAPWKGCLDPSRILTSLEEPRCHEEAKCLDGNICVRPIDGSFLRVTLADPPQTIPNRVVLWKGPSTEILEEVQVSSFRPRLSSMPLWLPLLLSRTSWYLKQVSLCLFFFNLLPMRQLDGGKLWHLLLRDSTDTYDLEEVRTYTRPSFLYRIHRGVFRVVPWLLTSSVVLLALRMWA